MNLKWIALFFFMISISLFLSMIPGIFWPGYGRTNPIFLLVDVIIIGVSGAIILPIFFRMLVSRGRRRREIRRDASDSGSEA
ncbi:TPA: hypothetical protein EYP37_11040 [Candidatus Poribacteria bacterium]|nr:hypothetical protein [Candidatus Poribacteria bacterium]